MLIARLLRVCIYYTKHIFIYNPFPLDAFFLPSNSLFLAAALGLTFGIAAGTRFGIVYGLGSSMAFTILSTFTRSFDPSAFYKDFDFFSYTLPATVLTGFVIGTTFAVIFANAEGTRVRTSNGVIRSIGLSIVLIIILLHLENANPEGIWEVIRNYGPTTGIIGCVSTAIALAIVRNVHVNTTINLSTSSFIKMLIRGITGGVISGIAFAFVYAIFSLVDFRYRNAYLIGNLIMVSTMLGFVGGIILSFNGTRIRRYTFIISSLIILIVTLDLYNHSFIIFKILSLGTSPFSFVYYAAIGLPLGAVGGSISWNRSWRTFSSICFIILILEFAYLISGRGATDFATVFVSCIITSFTCATAVSLVISLANEIGKFGKEMIRGLAFSTAIFTGAVIMRQIYLDFHAYTTYESAAIIGISCLVGYTIVYYRLPFYPIIWLSTLKTYHDTKKNPTRVFDNLHKSALYWDENIYLPLPYMKQNLHFAVEQSVDQALKEISFIMHERPLQINLARSASLEIAIRDLETRDTLPAIAAASQRLDEILLKNAKLMDPRWITPFARLGDVSRDASRFTSPIGRQAKLKALEDIRAHLRKVNLYEVFEEAKLNERLKGVVDTWLEAVKHEQERQDIAPEEIGQIDNPYIPGPALQLRNSLFVGRHDLVQQLEKNLRKDSHRPTFFLTGERRMGKSSTLNQLPHLLGARFLSITFDLQQPRLFSNVAAFLSAISKDVYQAMDSRGMKVKKLEYTALKEVGRENEANPYRLFDDWLSDVEYILEQEERLLLLAFDEFEKLQEAEQRGYLSTSLLLDWFRSAIQNYNHLAFIFSGVRTLGDMGASWANYFVSVQTLKVSFLHPSEARRLITKPVPTYPSEQLFGDGVVDEIIRVTGCHPFLVQAVCSDLIDHLNTLQASRAELSDVAEAVQNVLDQWWDTYFRDLWERTSQEEQMILLVLREMRQSDIQQIIAKSNQDEKAVRRTLNLLLKRDIVLTDDSVNYRIAAPIFEEWVKRSSEKG